MADRFGNPERGTGNPLGSGNNNKGIGKWGRVIHERSLVWFGGGVQQYNDGVEQSLDLP